MNLTKSIFVEYLDFPKRAWWKVNSPDTYKKICKLETEEQEDYIMWLGQVVEDTLKEYLEKKYNTKALDLMPSIQKTEESDDDDEVFINPKFNREQAIQATLQAIKDWVELLYQPTFAIDDCLVRADFMLRNSDGSYNLIESKAKANVRKDITDDWETKPIGKIDDKFIHDVSFQVYVINKVMEQHWLPLLKDTYLAHLNKDYLKQWPIDISQLLSLEQLGLVKEFTVIQRKKDTKIVRDDSLMDPVSIKNYTSKIKEELVLSEDEFNKRYPWEGTKYLDYFGQDKPFWTIMWAGVQNKGDIVSSLYYQWHTDILSLTEEEKAMFENKWGWGNAREFIDRYVHCKTTGEKIIHTSTIKEIFKGFQYPICFYDYESVCVPIPVLDNTHPYQHAIVQYSLHKYYPDGHMEHFGWVLAGQGDYRVEQITIEDNKNAVEFESEKIVYGNYKEFLQEFLKDIGEEIDNSTFIVWHQGFENARNRETAAIFPDLEDSFIKINESTFDLKDIFGKSYYFDVAFKGSASIKKVLPVMVPSMTYEGMEIGNGWVATQVLYKLIDNKIVDEAERIHKLKKLLLYCGQDSLAMVRIFESLEKIL